MVIINPGNPTGQCLSVDNLKEILRFCHQESLVLFGDEVYQQNVYQDERPFVSSRKVFIHVIVLHLMPNKLLLTLILGGVWITILKVIM